MSGGGGRAKEQVGRVAGGGGRMHRGTGTSIRKRDQNGSRRREERAGADRRAGGSEPTPGVDFN